MFQVLAHSVQDVLNAVGDGVDAVDGQLGVGAVAPVQVGLGLQLRRAQLSALVGAAQGLFVLVQLPQRGLGQDVAFRPIRGFQHVGRDVDSGREAFLHQVAQVEDGPARLRRGLLIRVQGYEGYEKQQGGCDDSGHYPA